VLRSQACRSPQRWPTPSPTNSQHCAPREERQGFAMKLFSIVSRPLPGLALCAAVAGCAVGPDFSAPAAPQTDRYTAQELPAQTVATEVPGGQPQIMAPGKKLPAQWWTLFGSDKLNSLVDAAFANSPSTAAARASLQQAQANLA